MRLRLWSFALLASVVWSGTSIAQPLQPAKAGTPNAGLVPNTPSAGGTNQARRVPALLQAPPHAAPNAAPAARFVPRLQTPNLTKAGKEGTLKPIDGPLFGERDRPGIADIRQGALGDCYFLAVASTIAQRRPDLIRNAIQELPDGTLKVRLFRRVDRPYGQPQLRPVWVRISRRVPHDEDGKQIYAKVADEATWPLLLEKAYAALRGGYPTIGRGGNGAEAMEALTGKPAAYTFMAFGKKPAPTAETLEAMEAAVRAGKPVTAGTTTDASFRERLEKLEREQPDSELVARFAKAEEGRPQMRDYGLVTTHAYSVLGFGEKDGTKLVVLRNPWGRFTPSRDGIDKGPDRKTNGVFALTMDEFKTFFRRVTIGNFAEADLQAAPGDEAIETIDAVADELAEQGANTTRGS